MDCNYHFFMDTIAVNPNVPDVKIDDDYVLSLDRYYREVPLLDVVPYNYAEYVFQNARRDYYHIIMVKDSRFKYVDCRTDDAYIDTITVKSDLYPDTDIFIFKLDKSIKSVTLSCYGKNEEDNITSRIFIISNFSTFVNHNLISAGQNTPHKSLIATNPRYVRFVFNPWECERTDVFVFHENMMIEHKCIHHESNSVVFKDLPLGYTATIIQTNSGKLYVSSSIKTNDNPPNVYY